MPLRQRRAARGRLLACLGVLLGFAGLSVVRAAPVEFDIPPQRADASLTQFARQSGIPVLFPYDLVSSRQAQSLRGRYEPAEGLRRLLQGTGLEARSEANGQISVRAAANAPRPPVNGLNSTLRREEAQPGDDVHEVTVTGSRIERDGMKTPTPVTAIYGAELQAMGPNSLVDALVQLPQFLNNDTPQTQSFATAGAAGSSFMNLRGIGSSRTLVLLDGRRVVPTTRAGAVDIALLPKTLIQRIEVVTGGASAAYGSDAVSGVVNILLDRDVDGLKLRAQGGLSELGDDANRELAASWGSPLGERSHLLVAAEYAQADGIRGYARRHWFQGWATITNPDTGGPAQVTVPDVHSTAYTYGGLITTGPLAGTQFLAGGVPAPFLPGTVVGATTQSGGSGVDPGRDVVWIMPRQTRASGFAKFDTGWDNGVTAYVQALAGYSDNAYEKDPSSEWGPWDMTIYADNAFLPQDIRVRMQAANLGSFRMGRVGALDLGSSRVHNRSRLLSTTVGAEASLPHDWNVEGYYQFGVNHAELTYANIVRLDRVYRAVDTVVDPAGGDIVCRSTLTFPTDGCVPADPFGPGSISPAANAWIKEGTAEQDQRVEQHVAEITLQGQSLQLPAGPVTTAVGAAWRRESLENHPHRFPSDLEGLIVTPDTQAGYKGLPAAYSGQTSIFERTAVADIAGAYSVREVFGEGVVPLVRDVPGLQRLDLNAALRHAHYSGSGGVLAWKAGLDWQMVRDLRLRATRSRDVRAGGLSERFDFSGSGSIVADRFLPNSPVYAITAIRGGNPAVEPERADTLTFGGVYQPSWLQGLSLSADYYDIKIHGAIASLGVQAVMDRCFAGEASLCSLITRSETSGQVISINNSVLNIAQARSRGIDAEMTFRRRVHLLGGEEGVALRLFGNYAIEASTTNIDEAPVDRAGQTGLPGGAPRWQANVALAYERGRAQVTVQERVISRGSYVSTFGPADIDDNRVGGAAYTNLRLAWRFGAEPGTLLLFANVSNLFDRAPPLAPDWGFAGSFHTNEGLFDAIGRRFTLGVRLRRQ
jgi:outer membrane receptor protein involved in Fe transport